MYQSQLTVFCYVKLLLREVEEGIGVPLLRRGVVPRGAPQGNCRRRLYPKDPEPNKAARVLSKHVCSCLIGQDIHTCFQTCMSCPILYANHTSFQNLEKELGHNRKSSSSASDRTYVTKVNSRAGGSVKQQAWLARLRLHLVGLCDTAFQVMTTVPRKLAARSRALT